MTDKLRALEATSKVIKDYLETQNTVDSRVIVDTDNHHIRVELRDIIWGGAINGSIISNLFKMGFIAKVRGIDRGLELYILPHKVPVVV